MPTKDHRTGMQLWRWSFSKAGQIAQSAGCVRIAQFHRARACLSTGSLDVVADGCHDFNKLVRPMELKKWNRLRPIRATGFIRNLPAS